MLFALTTAAAFVVLTGAALAQEDCVGGFHMIKDEIPISCNAGLDSSATKAAPVANEPVHTGSLSSFGHAGGNADEIPTPMTERSTSLTGDKCYGGYAYRQTANESYITMPMPCQ